MPLEDIRDDTKQNSTSLYGITALQRLIASNGVVTLAAILIGVVCLLIDGRSNGVTGSSTSTNSNLIAGP